MKRSEQAIAADVEMGLMLHAMLECAKQGLEEVSARLRADALERPEEHKPLVEGEREGMQWTAPGGLTVILTADKLKSAIERNGDEHATIVSCLTAYVINKNPDSDPLAKVNEFITATLKPWSGFERIEKDGLAFRKQVAGLLPDAPDCAAQIIDAFKVRDGAGVPKSDIKTEWSDLAKARAMEKTQAEAQKLMRKLERDAKKAAKP